MASMPLCFAIFSLLPPFTLPEDILGTKTEDFDFDGLPGVQHEFKVEVLAGKEECFFQAIKQGAQLHVSFEVSPDVFYIYIYYLYAIYSLKL